jgi:hypothetical protein
MVFSVRFDKGAEILSVCATCPWQKEIRRQGWSSSWLCQSRVKCTHDGHTATVPAKSMVGMSATSSPVNASTRLECLNMLAIRGPHEAPNGVQAVTLHVLVINSGYSQSSCLHPIHQLFRHPTIRREFFGHMEVE